MFGVLCIDDAGRVTAASKRVTELLGVEESGIKGRRLSEVIPWERPSDLLAGNDEFTEYIDLQGKKLRLDWFSLARAVGQRKWSVCVICDLSEIERMKSELASVRELKDELEAIFNSSYDEIFVIDGNGIAEKINKIGETYYGMPPEQLIGRSVFELEKEGYFSPSVTRLVMKEKKRVTITQKTRSGKQLIVTGNPVFNDRGEIVRIVVNSRDVSELASLRQRLEDVEQLVEFYRQQIMQLQKSKIQSDEIIACSPQMKQLLSMVDRVAQVDSTVFITGESGVGKGVIAARIHKLSKRSKGPFITINCGAIPENLIESELFGYEPGAFTGARREGKKGLIQLGHGGTVFLDEVAELPVNMQVKLLQVIQQRCVMPLGGSKPVEVDVRFISATNRDVTQMIREGSFREDLFYRLNVIPLTIQPLRYRREDIVPLINHFLGLVNGKYNMNKRFSQEALEILRNYHWPGNVREVENIVERLAVTTEGNEITPVHLPDYITGTVVSSESQVYVTDLCPLEKAIEQVERQLIQKAYERFRNTYRMAAALGVNQSTVVRKMHKYFPSSIASAGKKGGRGGQS